MDDRDRHDPQPWDLVGLDDTWHFTEGCSDADGGGAGRVRLGKPMSMALAFTGDSR